MVDSTIWPKNKLSINSKNLSLKTLFNVAQTSIASKISSVNSKKFSLLALQAVKSVQISGNNREKIYCQLKLINFVKVQGAGINKSR